MLRCPTCYLEMSDGAQYDAARVMEAVAQYIDDWFAGAVADEVLTLAKEIERIREETVALQKQRSVTWKHG